MGNYRDMKYLCYPMILMFFLHSCKEEKAGNGKDPLVQQFDQIYRQVESGQFDALMPYLDKPSLAYVESLGESQNLEFEKSLEIGKKYSLPFFTTVYSSVMKDHVKGGAPVSDFFKYLVSQPISFFNLDYNYETNLEKTTIHNGFYVALTREELGRKKLSYVNFTDEDGVYKLNLLYFLKLKEKKLKEQKESAKQLNYSDFSTEEFLKVIYDSYLEDPFKPNKMKFQKE